MKLDILTSLNAERDARRAAVVVTDQASGEQRLVKAADVAKDPLKRPDREAHPQRQERHGRDAGRQGLPDRACAGAAHRRDRRRPHQPGAGADAQNSSAIDVTIVDPRTAFATPERFPDVKVIAEWPDVALPPLGVDRYTAFVALTHDPKIDDPALTHALRATASISARSARGRRTPAASSA